MEQDFYSIVILAILMTPLCFPLQEIIFNIDPLSISDRKLKRFRTRLNRRLNDVNDYGNVFSSTTTELPVGEIIPEFTTDQLSAIRFGDWKMITGEIGYNRIIPNPITEIYRCELLKNYFASDRICVYWHEYCDKLSFIQAVQHLAII